MSSRNLSRKETPTSAFPIIKLSTSSPILMTPVITGVIGGNRKPVEDENTNDAVILGAVGASLAVMLLCAVIALFVLFRRRKIR